MNEARLLGTLGLARRAGKTVAGSDLVCKALRSGELSLVLLASDASDNTKKRITDKTTYYKVRLVMLEATVDMLGRSIGKAGSVSVVGVGDESFSRALLKHIDML